MITQLPLEIREQHEGKWIAWDTDTGEFLASADTIDDLYDRLGPIPKGRVVGFERILYRDAILLGGFEWRPIPEESKP